MEKEAAKLRRLVLILLFGAFFLVIALLLAITTIICLPYRLLVFALAKLFRPDLAGFVRGGGNVTFVFGSDTIPTANVCILLTLDGSLTLSELRKRFRDNVLNHFRPDGTPVYEKLQQTITRFMNYAFYHRVDHFQLSTHIREYDYTGDLALPSAGDWVTEKDLEKVVGKLIALPYPAGRSHWELLLINNFRSDGSSERKTMLVLRISHAIADGYSIQGLLVRLSDTPEMIKTFDNAPANVSLWKKALQLAKLPARLFWDAGEQSVNIREVKPCDWKIKRDPGSISETMSAFTGPISVEKIKAIKRANRISYASVLLTALSVAIHKLMTQAGQRVPNKLYCLLPAPKPNHPGGLTNHVLASLMPMPILPDSSASSLKEMDRHFKTVINSTASLLSVTLLDMNALLPLCLARHIYFTMKVSAAVGIFPVLSEKLTHNGLLASGCITFVAAITYPASGAATVSMGGINGQQRISMCIAKRAFPHPELFAQLPKYIEGEIKSMLANVTGEQETSFLSDRKSYIAVKKQA